MKAIHCIRAASAAAALLLGSTPAFAEDPSAESTATPPAPRIAVGVWRMGEDGLSTAFAQQLANTFNTYSVFELNPDAAKVRVQLDPIGKEPVGGHGAFTYTVKITPDGRPTTTISANCYEDDMADCATLIVERTYSAAVRARPEGLPK